MRRLLCTSVLSALFSAALVVVPVAAEPTSPRPHPVQAALRSTADTAASTRFSTVGATWEAGSTGTVEVRTRTDGAWLPWTALEATDDGPDATSQDHASASSKVVSRPIWVGRSDAFQSRTTGDVRGLEVVTVDGGTSAADTLDGPTGPGVARAAAAQPLVQTRADWGADESLRSFNGTGCATPDYSSTVKVGFVHHTAGNNGYTAAEVPGIIRAIYAYHVKSNGWCDIGYNFLVDSFGRVWEGRYGGINRAVIGAHTGGHNGSTFGAALLGTFTSVAPTTQMTDALQGLFAWKLSAYYADPTGTAMLTSGGGGTSRYAAGTTNPFPVVSGHRDAGTTACPGDPVYDQLVALREGIRTRMGAGLVGPASSAASATYAGSGVTVTSGVLKQQNWSLEVKRASDGVAVRSYTGATATSLSQPIDLKGSTGAWLPPGTYTLVLSSNAVSDVAVAWTKPLEITSSGAPPPPAPTSFTSVTPARVLDTRTTARVPAKGTVTVKVTGVGGVPATGVAAVALNLTGIAHGTPTFLSAYPADTAWPGTSSLNLTADQVHATLVVPKVSADGSVKVYNASGGTDVVLDVVGYLSTETGPTYTPVTPTRVLDTRTSGTPYGNGTVRTVQIAGNAGVPTEATAVVANVTVTGTGSNGLATVFPSGTSRPGTSTLNFVKGETATNRFVSGLTEGALSVYTQVTRADVLIDVVGYFGGTTGASYFPVKPARVLDTRTSGSRAPVAGGGTLAVPLANRGGVPADAKAVALTLTTTGVSRSGYVTAWSGAGSRPGVSDLNTWAAHDVSNLVVVQLSGGSASLYNFGGPAHLIGDVVGYFT